MIGTQTFTPLDLTRPGIIEASAGTGKTFTIAEIYLALLRGEKTLSSRAFLKENASTPSVFSPTNVRNILVVTFTDAATAELRARLRKKIREALAEDSFPDEPIHSALRLAEAEFDESAVFTIHGFCLRILKEFGLSSRIKEIQSSLADELARFATRWRARKIANGESLFFDITPKDICSILNPLLQNPDIIPVPPSLNDNRGHALFEIATEAFAEWKALRQNARDISYGEILVELRDALRRNPLLAKKISARFTVAIVDEFQDTDPIQWEIFRRIFLANERPIFCVGDPKQAIYEFRGGDVHTYRRARKKIQNAGNGNTTILGENWRSAPETIAAFNELFSADENIAGNLNIGTYKKPRLIKTQSAGILEYTPVSFPSEKSRPTNDSAIVPAAVLKVAEPASNKNTAAADLVKHVVNDIADLVNTRGVPAHDIAILVSDNAEANCYRSALADAKIPVSTTARGNVLCDPIAQATSDILRAILEPQNTAVFRRALLTPFFAGVGEKLLFENESSAETEMARRAFSEAHDDWTRKSFLPAFRALSEKLGFFKNISTLPTAKTLATNILHLTEILHTTEQRAKLLPRTLANTFDLMRSAASPLDDSEQTQLRTDSDQKAVRILTVHKSKGLEFEIVFIPSLWSRTLLSKNFPDWAKGTENKNETTLIFDASEKSQKTDAFLSATLETARENAACLFYVALTRARSRLVIYHVPQLEKNQVWNSYQKQILDAAGAFSENPETTLPHWKILEMTSALPDDAFPRKKEHTSTDETLAQSAILSNEDAEVLFEKADLALKKLLREMEGLFSFSRIIRATESDETLWNEDDENTKTTTTLIPEEIKDVGHAESFFSKRSYSDLPAGAEFGTIAHLVFEKIDFRSRKKLPSLLNLTLPRLRNWTTTPTHEQEQMKENFITMVDENLTLPLTNHPFKLENLDEKKLIKEMEFYFPLKHSRQFYAELSHFFTSLGGVYAETADRHWTKNGAQANSSLNISGMMTGVIDLVFQEKGQFFILDWKTNAISAFDVPDDFKLPASALREEIVKHGYALQWTIYTLALRRFLRQSLGDAYDHDRDFGGIIYFFVRWRAPFIDTNALTSERLDAFERLLI